MYEISFLLTFNLEYLQSISLVYLTQGASLAVSTLFGLRYCTFLYLKESAFHMKFHLVHETEEYLSRVPRSVPSSI